MESGTWLRSYLKLILCYGGLNDLPGNDASSKPKFNVRQALENFIRSNIDLIKKTGLI